MNESVTMSTMTEADGKYAMTVPTGTYDIKLERTVNGRRKWMTYDNIRLGDGNMMVDLAWPTVENASERSALVMQHFDAGRAAHDAGRYQDAIVHFGDALRVDCSQHAVYSAMAVSQAMAGAYDAAERSSASALAWGAGTTSMSNLAYAYYKSGRFENAGMKYEAAARMDSSKAAMYYANAGAAYLSGRINAKAESAYKMAANANGGAANSWYFWGVCAQGNNNNADALTALRGYLQKEPNGRYAADARQRITAMGG
jgi:tetratricopeptide (TPR) repeat protein